MVTAWEAQRLSSPACDSRRLAHVRWSEGLGGTGRLRSNGDDKKSAPDDKQVDQHVVTERLRWPAHCWQESDDGSYERDDSDCQSTSRSSWRTGAPVCVKPWQ